MNILLLAPYPPYPPFGGGTMRIYQIARGLAAHHELTCLTFAPDAEAETALEPLRDLCRVVVVRGPDHRSAAQRAWTTIASPLPDMALRNRSAAYAEALRGLLARERFDVVQAESIEMAPYLAIARAATPRPLLVFDQFNAEYVIQKRAAQTSAAALRQRQITPRNLAGVVYSSAQWVKLARFERAAMRACDLVLAVSEEDRQTLRGLLPSVHCHVVPNGVDTTEFSRHAVAEPVALPQPALVFSGTLDYRANIDAVLWFANDVLPRIRARHPAAHFVVVGRRPPPELHALPAEAVTIVGAVPDARPYTTAAAAYVVPMRIGGGARLKLLEALSLEAPVVCTTMGAEGIRGLASGHHCQLADDPAAMAEAVLRLIDEPQFGRRLGAAGRELVQASYDWQVIIPQLEAAYRSI